MPVSLPKWPKRQAEADRLAAALSTYAQRHRPLPGVAPPGARDALVAQMVSSQRRLDHTRILLCRGQDPRRADPNDPMFDPERAAVVHLRAGRLDEAVWLIFLATHFGRHLRDGWRMLADVYSGLGKATWTWDRVSRDPAAFRAWLTRNADRIGGAFGNHRKYESLNGDRASGTGAVVESYIAWVGRDHGAHIARLVREAGNDPNSIFDHFYRNMTVARFGRLGKFDFLCLLGRLGLAPIAPGSPYLSGATGPRRGARLLFGGQTDAPLHVRDLEVWARELDDMLGVGMQVMEDSLCNWQKSPTRFVHFRG